MAVNEIQLQAECFTWFHNTMWNHRGKFRRVKNETDNFTSNKSRMAQGVMNKATGIVAGTWDAFLIHQPIVWIEFKYGTNKLSDEQNDFMLKGVKCGWIFHVVYNLPDFQTVIYTYLK